MTTEEYYQHHAQQFFKDTVSVDMSSLYRPFCDSLSTGAKILDAGCGSGRDSKAFALMGYDVEAFDASPELAHLATQYSGIKVKTLHFNQLDSHQQFDGIWCCASLLHVAYAELTGIFIRLYQSCKPGAVIYISFKYGDGERQDHGRSFTDLNEKRLEQLLLTAPGLSLKQQWVTEDKRPERNERWLNALLLVG